jgi:hypothetical protein
MSRMVTGCAGVGGVLTAGMSRMVTGCAGAGGAAGRGAEGGDGAT